MKTLEQWLRLHRHVAILTVENYNADHSGSPRYKATLVVGEGQEEYLYAIGSTIDEAQEALDDQLSTEAGTLLAASAKDLDE
jgi:hypothetical protein